MSSSQNYIFRMHQSGEASVQLECWEKSSPITAEDLTSVQDTVDSRAAKVATSVPSPFARMHLFDTAFRIVASAKVPFTGDSMYHQLVSDCLDMFQMMYEHGADSELVTIKNWNRDERLAEMRSNGVGHPHHLLADALDKFIGDRAQGSMSGTKDINLIYYNEILVGGTCPQSIFFTSANWKRRMDERNWTIPSKTDDVWFDDEYAPLHIRDQNFVEFMVKFYLANKASLAGGIEKYLRTIIEEHLPDLHQKTRGDWSAFINNPSALEEEYARLETGDSNTQMRVGNISLWRQTSSDDDIETSSEFVMRPSVRHFEYEPDNSDKIRTPLVLVQGMDLRLQYIGSPWDPTTHVPYTSGVLLSERRLPGVNVRYPYITTDDFLSDQLVKLPYKVNKNDFVINCHASFEYLLPIKKDYFKFFTKEDLKNNLRIDVQPSGEIKVELDIPIVNNQKITFIKKYPPGHDQIAEARIGLGIFPFYRIEDCPDEIAAMNEHTVFMADKTEQPVELEFYRFSTIRHAENNNYDGRLSSEKITRSKLEHQPTSNYYELRDSFDVMGVNLKHGDESFEGILVPDFRTISYNSQNTGAFNFAIDFGTSNTHIAYTGPNNAKPKALDVGEQDKQVILLSESKANEQGWEKYHMTFTGIPLTESLMNREFVPSLIGNEHNAKVAFPIRTASFEIGHFDSESDPKLFKSSNIGFSIDQEFQKYSGRYKTNLKWLFEMGSNDKDNDRIRLFFEQILRIIKHKVLLNNGDLNQLRILWLLPGSAQSDRFEPLWEDASKAVFKDNWRAIFELNPIPESVAPYFYLRTDSAITAQAASAMNIDIGGGTTDVMYFNRKDEEYYSTSFLFAGNDIWGDGLLEHASKENGFILNFRNRYDSSPAAKEQDEDRYLSKSLEDSNLDSADVVSLLFKYDKHFKFSDSILGGNPNLKFVLILHYAAIIYHLIEWIKKNGMELPRYFTFSGKGSQYINLLCSRSEITRFTTMLLKAFAQDLQIPNDFKVVLNDDPKAATANGAILYDKSLQGQGGSTQSEISREKIKEVVYLGHAQDLSTTFGRTTKYEQLDAEFYASVIKNNRSFIEALLDSEDIQIFLNKKGITATDEIRDYLIGGNSNELEDSKDEMMIRKKKSASKFVQETCFFFPLKNTLYNMGRHLAEKAALA